MFIFDRLLTQRGRIIDELLLWRKLLLDCVVLDLILLLLALLINYLVIDDILIIFLLNGELVNDALLLLFFDLYLVLHRLLFIAKTLRDCGCWCSSIFTLLAAVLLDRCATINSSRKSAFIPSLTLFFSKTACTSESRRCR